MMVVTAAKTARREKRVVMHTTLHTLAKVSFVLLILSSLGVLMTTFSWTHLLQNNNSYVSTPSSSLLPARRRRLVVITPTYERARVRRKYTLSHMFVSMCDSSDADIWWYLIDENISDPIPSFANQCPHVHVTRVPAPPPRSNTTSHRGLDHRNAGLELALRDHEGMNAAVYFADDDNLYSSKIWPRAAQASHGVLFWPIGFMTHPEGAEAPVHTKGEIHGFQTIFCPKPPRRFGIDMAGFAVPLDATVNVTFRHEWTWGRLETKFLEELERRGARMGAVTSDDVLVWHINWSTADVVNFTMHVPKPKINCKR